MKRFLFFCVSIALVILVSLGVWFVNRPKPKPVSSSSSMTSAKLPVSVFASSSLLVTPIEFSVFLAPMDGPEPDFQEIQKTTQAYEGSIVKTNASGRALLEGINTTVMDTNSEIFIQNLDSQKNQTKLQLQAGQVWSRVKKLSDKGEFYEIETQNVHASVRGTSFGLSKKGKTTTLYVVEGVVNFGPIAPTSDVSIQYSSVNVPAGKKAVLHDGDFVPTVSDLTDADKRDPWFVYNNPVIGVQPSSNPQTSQTISESTPSSTSSSSVPVTPAPITTTPEPTSVPVAEPTSTPTPIVRRTITPATSDSTELLLSSVSPTTAALGTSTNFTLTGTGFVKAGVNAIYVGSVKVTTFQIVNDSTIQLTLNTNTFSTGEYDLTVVEPSGLSSSLSPGLTISRIPLP